MSATDFLPRRQADLLAWSTAFRNQIVADPEACGLTAAQAAEYSTLHDAFAQAYALSQAPSTATTSQTKTKNAAMHELRQRARQYAWIIHSHRISDTKKRDLGLTIRRPGGKQRRIPRPAAPPEVHVHIERGREVHIRLRDPAEPTRVGKPRGVESALVFTTIGDTPPMNIRDWSYAGAATRTKVRFAMPADLPPGTRVWIAACWTNPRGEQGPASTPRCVRINFDAPPALRLSGTDQLQRPGMRIAA